MTVHEESDGNKFPAIMWRVVATIMVVTIKIVFSNFWHVARGTVEGSMAAEQLKNDAVTYVWSSAIAGGAIAVFSWAIFLILLVVIWLPYLARIAKVPVKTITKQ